MRKFALPLALACVLAAAPSASFADGPPTRTAPDARPAPRSYQSPTDEYVPPLRTPPRAQRTLRRAPAVRDGSLTAYIGTLPSYLTPPSLGDLAPASGLTYFYSAAPSASTYYYYPYPQAAPGYAPDAAAPPVPPGIFTQQDFDGAPCPTRLRTSLGELFACTR
jgi:hypothetical protein